VTSEEQVRRGGFLLQRSSPFAVRSMTSERQVANGDQRTLRAKMDQIEMSSDPPLIRF
jgi:hypothetical protein